MKACLKVLDRRANWLEARAAIRSANGNPSSFDDGEIAALRWAAGVVRKCAVSGNVDREDVPDICAIHEDSRIVLGTKRNVNYA